MDEVAVISCKFIERGVVEVKGTKRGTKAPREYTVHFDNRGNMKFGHLWIPMIDDESYLQVDMIPQTVRQAAVEKYRKENGS